MTSWVGLLFHWLRVVPQWGDVATWVTAGAVLVAWVSFRREAERDRSRQDEWSKRHAELVGVWLRRNRQPEKRSDFEVVVMNAGALPIRDALVTLVVKSSATPFDYKSILTFNVPLAEGGGAEFTHSLTLSEKIEIEIADRDLNGTGGDVVTNVVFTTLFTDTANQTWLRLPTGSLTRLVTGKDRLKFRPHITQRASEASPTEIVRRRRRSNPGAGL